jgi:O-antigen/teichoic acid export membrane protein
MSVLSTSAKGASFLILFQLASRGFTFFINQILLRYLSPEILGLSAQLDLFARTVISFSRDSIEVAAQRQANDAQPIVNLAYLAIAFGAPLAYGLASVYLKTENSGVPHFASALWIYAASCIIELCAAPAYAVAQQRLLFKVRASAETVATIFRCLSTCLVAVWASKSGTQAGVLPFAAGQLSFALGTLAVYLFNVAPIARSNNFSLLPRRING